MSNILQQILEGPPLESTAFPPNSRYHGLRTLKIDAGDGTFIVYLTRRFVPPLDRAAVIRAHVVSEGERLDNITALYLVDPELFWRVCDANGIVRPDDLTARAGAEIRIPLPAGVPNA